MSSSTSKNPFVRSWSRGKSFASTSIKELGTSPQGSVELNIVDQTADWRKSPAASGASTETIIKTYSCMTTEEALVHLQSQAAGLTNDEAAERLKKKGKNILTSKKPPAWWQLLLGVIPNPFNILLAALAVISVATPPPQWSTFILLMVMIVISCAVRFWQEFRSSVAAIKLQSGITTDVRVRRHTSVLGVEDYNIDQSELVPGDILYLESGLAVPADCMVLESTSLQISQSSLTGESEALAKTPAMTTKMDVDLFDLQNVVFMGTGVVSGSGLGLVIRTGDDAFIATIMKQLNKSRPLNSFQRGIRNVTYLMIVFMLVMVPIVLVINGKITGDFGQAALFSVSVAVGLVPEMLPAIVNANLARGAFTLAKKKAIVKRLDAIQNLGGMTVLCSDKTGTLTKDKIVLCDYIDALGNEAKRVLKLAIINAFHQTGKKNSIDEAILEHNGEEYKNVGKKLAEIPFTFESRRSSAIVQSPNKIQLICKGAFEEVSSLCDFIRIGADVVSFDAYYRQALTSRATDFNNDGYRVILVASREVEKYELGDTEISSDMASHLIVEGLLTFLDPPKDDALASVTRLRELGVDVRVLTGDNMGVALKVCKALDIVSRDNALDDIQAISGPDLARLEGQDFHDMVQRVKIFAKLTPTQKGEVVLSLKAAGHSVGMLGDGINDCVALRHADAGISVDSGMAVAKDCADIILTEKALSIIVDGVITGRITHGNTIKYIKMVASSNFGNVFSILAASAWLPFEPMTSLQILIQNLLYDISQIAIPWDRLDEEYLATPHAWDVKDLLRFIVILGPTSSTIDICTFLLNWFYFDIRSADDTYGVKLFHTHWFIEGLLTQTLIVHLLRTAKVPVLQSRASRILVASTVTIMLVGFTIPWIEPIANALGMVRPKPQFVGFLVAELTLYCIEVQLLKMVYIKLFGKWL